MELQELLSVEKILLIQDPGPDKLELLRELLSHCVRDTDLEKNEAAIEETLIARENSMSTGIGEGVAIPHCSTEHVQEMSASLALLGRDLDFQALDGEPVRIVVLLLMPKNKFEKHIRTLATIAKLFKDAAFRDRILLSDSPETARGLINERLQNLV